jgi:maleate isomerase
MIEYKFGLIVPSSNTTMESELWRFVSGWATIHTARMRLEDITIHDLERMEEQAMDAALRLSDAHVDVIGYGCTSGSLFRGGDHYREIERKITTETGIPCAATAGAVIEALNMLGVSSISVATPYTDEINTIERSFLEQHHKTVHEIKGLSIVDNREVGQKNPKVAYELAKEVYRREADGVFISCTNFRTVEIINLLEKELGVPVISSNTATLWAMMKKLKIEKRIEGLGALFL